MPSKEKYCYRILKSYSLIVDFDGIPQRENVPAPVEGENFRHWKERVLGSTVSNVVLYVPEVPSSGTKISTIQSQASAKHLEKVFKYFSKEKDDQKTIAVEKAVDHLRKTKDKFQELAVKKAVKSISMAKDQQKAVAINEAVTNTEQELASISKDTLELLLKKYDTSLELSVRDFFDRYIKSTEKNIKTEQLLGDLIKTYNDVVKRFREVNQR